MRFVTLLFIVLGTLSSQAQTSSRIQEKTKNMKLQDGYFPFWWDAANGKIWLLVNKTDQEFLYVNTLPAGLGSNDIGLDRGQIGDTRIVFFHRVGKKLMLIQPNYDYRATSNNGNEQRAVKESFAQSTIAAFSIDEEENGNYLIDFTPFLLRDAHGVADKIRSMRHDGYTKTRRK